MAAGFARLTGKNIRLTVLVCVALICGSFAAAAVLQMRGDRVHALAQARVFEAERAADIAATAAATLDRLAAEGRAFADGKPVDGTANGIGNITVFDASGLALATHSRADQALPADTVTAGVPRVLAPGTLIFPYGVKTVALSFDPHVLVPARLLVRAAVVLKDGKVLLGDAAWSGGGPATAIAGWPVTVRASVDETRRWRRGRDRCRSICS
ncbi:MAG: hypothetical protein WDM81_07385 [Rhizomicrobium sp.]